MSTIQECCNGKRERYNPYVPLFYLASIFFITAIGYKIFSNATSQECIEWKKDVKHYKKESDASYEEYRQSLNHSTVIATELNQLKSYEADLSLIKNECDLNTTAFQPGSCRTFKSLLSRVKFEMLKTHSKLKEQEKRENRALQSASRKFQRLEKRETQKPSMFCYRGR